MSEEESTSTELEFTDFNSLFNLIVLGREVSLRFGQRAEFDSLRASLSRRFKGYKPLMLLLDQPDSYIKCTCEKLENVQGFKGTFKLELTEHKTNTPKRTYQLLGKL